MLFARRSLRAAPLALAVAATLASSLGGAAAARGDALDPREIVPLAESPVALVAPRATAAWIAGSDAELAWTGLAAPGAPAGLDGLDGLDEIEEWEAFLSVDDGRSFPIRLTPHLDLAVRRFVFRVPDLPSHEVRLLLRFGNEREERSVLLPQRFAIARNPVGGAVFSGDYGTDLIAARAWAPGEPARTGDPGVVLWTEGRRDGSAIERREAAPAPGVAGVPPALAAADPATLANDDGHDSSRASGDPLALAPTATIQPSPAITPPTDPPFAPDILLLIQRQNE